MFGKVLALILCSFLSLQAEANCFSRIEGKFKRFVCSDGTVQKVSIENEQIVVKTYSPESRKWSEVRFPAPVGATVDTVNVSFQE